MKCMHTARAPRRILRTLCCLCCALSLITVGTAALADDSALFVFPYEGFRFEAPTDARVLTQHNLGEHVAFLGGLGTDIDTMLAGMQSANVVMEVFPAQGGQLELSLAPADGITGADATQMSDESRASLLAAYDGMPRYQDVAFSTEQPNWLRMVFSTQQGDVPVYTLRYITLAHGQQYLLSNVLIGREPEATDDAQVLDAIGRISFLSARQTPEPTATPQPTPTPTATPLPTPGVAEQIAQELGDNISLTVAPIPAWIDKSLLSVTGAATARATVRMLWGDKLLAKATAGEDGAFALDGTLRESGDYEITIEAAIGENKTSETYKVRMEEPKLWLTISEPIEPVARKQAAVKGKTEPDAKVDIRGSGLVTNVRANKSGDFSFRIDLEEEGDYPLTLKVTLKGYQPFETSYTVTRVFSEKEALSAFRIATIPIAYNMLLKDPAPFIGKRASFRAIIVAVGELDGKPCLLVNTRAKSGHWDQPIWAVCTELPPYKVGEVLTVYIQPNGKTMPYTDATGLTTDVPVTDLRFYSN